MSLLNDAASEMIFPLLPLFLVSTLGAGPAFLGLVEGVAETTASMVKLAGGWLSDRLRRRKPWIVWGYGVAAVVRPAVALATLPWHVLAVRFTDRLGKGVRTAPRDALLAASVPPSRRGTAFGVHRAADHVGAVIGPLLAAGLLLLFPGELRLVFALSLVPGMLAVLIVLARVREVVPAAPPIHDDDPAPGPPAPAPSSLARSRPGTALSPAFRRYIAVLALFTLGNASDAFLLLRAQDLGVGVAAIPLLWGALHVSKSLWNVVGGALADRLGSHSAIVGGWAVYALTYAGFALADAAWHVWALFLLYGLFYGLTEAPEKALVAGLSGAERRGTAYGAYHFAIGLAALPASVLFGAVWQTWGATAAFLLGAGIGVAAAALLVLLVPAPSPRTT